MSNGGFDGRFLWSGEDETVRILHVDDDPAFRDLTRTFLEQLRERFAVTSVADPRDALDHIDDADCIVSDYQMPEVDGLDLLELVRERDDGVPFVLFTGQGSEEIASEAISAGVTDYLQKEGTRDQFEVLANRVENVVARHRSERRLRASQRGYRELTAASPVPMGIHTKDDGIVYVNDAGLEFFGANSPDDVLGRSAFSFVHPDDRHAAARRIRSLFEGHGSVPGEPERFVGVDGEVRTGVVSAIPTTVDGQPAAHVVIDDISSYLDAKSRVETEQSLVQAIIDTLDDLVYVFEGDSLVRWNERVPEVTGYDESTLSEMDPLEFVAEADRERAADYLDRVAETGSGTATLDLVTSGGARITYEFEGFSVDSDVPFRVGIAREHEDDEADRELESYRKLVEAIGDPMYVLDESGVIETANEAMAEIIGLPKAEIVGSHAARFMDEGGFEHGSALIADVLADPERRSGTYEFTVVRPDGGRTRVEDNVTPLLDERGNYVGSAGVIRDISERKRRERELERQNERLDEFASVLSHDLRNPLNVAQATVELLAESERDELPEHLDILRESHERMADIVDDALTLAKEGTSVTEPTPTDLDAVAEAAVASVDTADHTVDLAAEGTVLADEPRLQRLLENLLRNCVEHGGTAVRVGSLHDEAGETVGFYVEDDGPGIPEDDRDAVFESGVTTSETGTGFGLAIVRQLAEAHGWSVRVTEGDLGGARFEVRDVTPA